MKMSRTSACWSLLSSSPMSCLTMNQLLSTFDRSSWSNGKQITFRWASVSEP